MPGYASVDSGFVSSKVEQEIFDYLYIPLYNISAILGDIQGNMSDNARKVIVKYVNLKSPGVMTDIPDEILTEETEYSDILGPEMFYVEVPRPVYLMYDQMKYRPVFSYGRKDSPLINNLSGTDDSTKSSVCLVYLSTIYLYSDLLEYSEVGKINMTRQDIKNIESNIRWITPRLDPEIHYNLITPLRELQKILQEISNLTFLFRGGLDDE